MNPERSLAAPVVIILAAGQGKRMRSTLPKVLHEAAGKPLLGHVLDAARTTNPREIVVVVGHGAEEVKARFADQGLRFALQREQLGTGHAVAAARDVLEEVAGPYLVLFGDGPLVTPESLQDVFQAHHSGGGGLTLLTYEVEDPSGLGRVVRTTDGALEAIVEERDAPAELLGLREVSPGTYLLDDHLWSLLATLKSDNAAGEYYLTDLVAAYRERGLPLRAVQGFDETRLLVGVNDPEQLAVADRLLRARRGE
jgi:bifunctional UDP-N-acetylglucosamine pyrophosphorylase/glucosamine-1-phosphate N-acetyltransferase